MEMHADFFNDTATTEIYTGATEQEYVDVDDR
jgi:hypothetical protein